jgi:hypothetical protein
MRTLPVYITESNQDAPWLDQNTGWVQAAYAEIDGWNQRADTQTIHCLCLYRWNRDDQWTIEPKGGVQTDFAAAVARGYTRPAQAAQVQTQPPHTVNIPSIPNAQPAPKPIWDMRLTQRGASVQTPAATGPMWRVIMGRWMPEDESGGRHHIYVDVLDEHGKRVPGVPLLVNWPGGSARIMTEAKPNEPYSGNFPMTASRNEFSIRVDDGTPSELVTGIGMGAMTPGGFNAGIHTSTILHFQRVAQAAPQPSPVLPTPPEPAPDTGSDAQVPAPPSGADCWARAMAFVARWEGGWADNPNDPGGATNKGITLSTYARWRQAQGQPVPSKDDLRAIPDAEVDRIYREWYWLASGADKLPWPLCLAQFDTAVNAGVGRAEEMLRRSDGDFIRYMGHLIDWYTRIDNFEHFGRAWIRRRAEILLEAVRR